MVEEISIVRVAEFTIATVEALQTQITVQLVDREEMR
jgi:hypothetical protein